MTGVSLRRMIIYMRAGGRLIIAANLIVSARLSVCRKINVYIQRISALVVSAAVVPNVTFGVTVSVSVSVAAALLPAAVAGFISIRLRRRVIAVMNAVISLIPVVSVAARRVRRASLMMRAAVIAVVSARRNLRAAFQRSVRRRIAAALSLISFRSPVRRRLIILIALRIVSA
jgi:hypothetical protein